ncbi:hypothetical protein [Nocardioides sp. zg-1228]|uniref:hypothetical protein n=1 Tax=Nocardioides sp. zg-1228 TaxID=2763008 RepID=UPI001642F22F|nr:hypothetical protein [Nocardioides sp. zg-1228]MBC2932886.1 hypothetical protein [Nocardioides sp. zg-1228]QSF56906.1 hypothetical protein JX575_15120 [Nocardioides sp. zg-1228]
MQTTCIQLGGALGTAVLSAVVAGKVSTSLHGTAAPAGTEEAASAGVPIPGLPQAAEAFMSGLHTGLVVSAVLVWAAALLALLALRLREQPPRDLATVLEETVGGEAGHP